MFLPFSYQLLVTYSLEQSFFSFWWLQKFHLCFPLQKKHTDNNVIMASVMQVSSSLDLWPWWNIFDSCLWNFAVNLSLKIEIQSFLMKFKKFNTKFGYKRFSSPRAGQPSLEICSLWSDPDIKQSNLLSGHSSLWRHTINLTLVTKWSAVYKR